MSEAPLRIVGIGDGRSRHLARWARRLVERGHDMHVVTNREPVRPEELEDVHVHLLRDVDPFVRVRGFRRFRVAGAVRKACERLTPDVVHAHDLSPYGWWAARAGVRPLVVSPWGNDALVEPRDPAAHARARDAVAAGERFVVNSRALEQATIDLGADPASVRLILWHVAIDRFEPGRADAAMRGRFGWPDDALVVLSLRNFRPETNLDVLVRAFAAVRSREPRARLLLGAGGGWTRPETEALVVELELAPYVAVETIGRDELPGTIAAADLAVSLQDSDSSPASLLESMASGLPLVAGRAASIDEWLADGEGAELVPSRDVDAVARAILKLLGDPELRRRYGERNAREVRVRFGDPGAELEAVYREVAERRAGTTRRPSPTRLAS